jgi:transmembrane sensor
MGPHSSKEIEILLIKYLEKSCTPEEKLDFYSLLSSADDERTLKEIFFSHLAEFNEDQYKNHSADFDRIYNQILSEINERDILESEKRLMKRRTRVRQLVIQGLSLAAVFCIAFFLGTIISKNNGKTLVKQANAVTYNEIKAPYGARSEIRLADGSQVTLNSGSIIKYRSDYNSDNRELTLEGEAYFKVAKNTDLPLIVSTGSINIKATGTEFNVKAYKDEGLIETTLIEGKVEITQKNNKNEFIKLLELAPNQKAIYVKEGDNIKLEDIKEIESSAVKPVKVFSDKLLVSPKADVEQVTAWIQNKLIIRGEDLENLCIKLQRKYDVTFVFGNEEIKKYRFSGVLFDETLEQVLKVIKLTAPIDYLVDGKVVLIVANSEQAERYSKHLKKSKN